MRPVEVRIENRIATVTLNRPEKRNAVDMPMFLGLDEARKKLLKDTHVRAIMIQGSGQDFCSGLDTKSVMTNKTAALKLLWKWRPGAPNLAQRVAMGWRKIPVPVFALIHGRCWGAGMQIALGCDFRISTPDASLSIMESRWGLIPDMGGTLGLRDCLSQDQAMLLAMSSRELSGLEAEKLGLVTITSDAPHEAADELLAPILIRSPDAVGGIKRLFTNSWAASQNQILRRETRIQLQTALTRNRAIAVRNASADEAQEFEPRR